MTLRYTLGGFGITFASYQLYTNITMARGMTINVQQHPLPLPPNTLLAEHEGRLKSAIPDGHIYSDLFSTRAPPVDVSNNEELNEVTKLCANAFLHTPAFGWELFIINLARGRWRWRQPFNDFDKGSDLGMWRVIERTPSEVLMEWHDPITGLTGHTYIAIHIPPKMADGRLSPQGSQLSFGSSIVTKKPLLAMTNFHTFYSKLLLTQTLNTMRVYTEAASSSGPSL